MSGPTLQGGGTGAGTVVEMQRFQARASLTPIRQAEAYWTALRDGGDVPLRTQIDPRGLQDLLEYAFVIERVAPGIARIRLAGQHLTSAFGMELRGMPLSAVFAPAARDEIKNALVETFDAPAVCELSLTSEARYGHPAFNAHMILLPLKSDLGDVSRALGVLVSEWDGNTPSSARFKVTGAVSRHVSGPQHRSPDRPADHATGTGFREPAAGYRADCPRLRLVKSDP